MQCCHIIIIHGLSIINSFLNETLRDKFIYWKLKKIFLHIHFQSSVRPFSTSLQLQATSLETFLYIPYTILLKNFTLNTFIKFVNLCVRKCLIFINTYSFLFFIRKTFNLLLINKLYYLLGIFINGSLQKLINKLIFIFN